jgi:mannose-6-phosphate isomerase-like protein (cupin superfamily)
MDNRTKGWVIVGVVVAASVGIAVFAFKRQRKSTGLRGTPGFRPFVTNIEQATLKNTDYRRVLTTAPHSQLVLMSVKPNDEIGAEIHPDNDQFIRIESGHGLSVLNGKRRKIRDGTALVIPAGTRHNVINTSATQPLKLYTLYSPAHEARGLVQRVKPV